MQRGCGSESWALGGQAALPVLSTCLPDDLMSPVFFFLFDTGWPERAGGDWSTAGEVWAVCSSGDSGGDQKSPGFSPILTRPDFACC